MGNLAVDHRLAVAGVQRPRPAGAAGGGDGMVPRPQGQVRAVRRRTDRRLRPAPGEAVGPPAAGLAFDGTFLGPEAA